MLVFYILSFNPITSIHHTSMDIWNLKLVPCKQTYEMHIQMHHTSSWACSPYLCAQNFNWSLSLSYLSSYVNFHYFFPFYFSRYHLCLCFSPFVINDHKCLILDRLRLSMSINGLRIIFPNLVQSRTFAKDI